MTVHWLFMSAVSCTVTEVMFGCFANIWMLFSISHGCGKWKIGFQLILTLSAQECLTVRSPWLCSQAELSLVFSLFRENGALLCGWTLTGMGAALQKETWECWWVKTPGLCWGSVTSRLRNVVLHHCSALVTKHLEGWSSSGLPSLRETKSGTSPTKASKVVMNWSTGHWRRGGRSEANSGWTAEGFWGCYYCP